MRYNLGDYEKELAQDGFFRIHRGYLVSLRHVQSLGKHEVTLTGGVVLHVSRTKEKATERSAISVHTRGSDLMEQTQRILSSLFAFQRPRMVDYSEFGIISLIPKKEIFRSLFVKPVE